MYYPILKTKQLNVFSSDRLRHLLREVSLKIEQNKFYIVYGQNGAGKSTLLLTLQDEVNQFVIEGKRVCTIRHIPLLPQQVEHYFVGHTPWEEFVLTWESHLAAQESHSIEAMEAKIYQVVDMLHLHAVLHRSLQTLSGGQLQLVALASVLLMDVKLILIDEMTTMLDQSTRVEMLETMRSIQQNMECTIIYVTHDEQEVKPTDLILYVEHQRVSQLSYEEWTERCLSEAKQSLKTDDDIQPISLFNEQKGLPSHPAILKVNNITVDYSTQFSNQVFSFNRATLTHIEGENGAGKSTLLKAIAGEIPLLSGQIMCNDIVLSQVKINRASWNMKLLQEISYCPQFLSHYWSKETVLEECYYVAHCFDLAKERNTSESLEQHIKRYLSYFGLNEPFYTRSIYSLSMGQQKKLALAICFMLETEWVVLDEPYAYLDKQSMERLTCLIEKRVEQGSGVLLVSHEKQRIDVINEERIWIQANANHDSVVKKKSKKNERESVIALFHPLVLQLCLMSLTIVLLLYASPIEVGIVFVVSCIINTLILKRKSVGLYKLIIMYSLIMLLISFLTAYNFTDLTLDETKMKNFSFYAFKLVTMIMLSYPMLLLISPFRLMRTVQQLLIKLRLKRTDDISIYLVMIIFRFINLLQQLWVSLNQLYRTKYKRLIIQGLVTYFVHYIRECLFIAEAIIRNYEIRQPLKLASISYKIKLRRQDTILIVIIAISSSLIIAL